MAARRFVIQYCPVPDSLVPYVSSIFYWEIAIGDGECLSDILCPDWASIRFHYGTLPRAQMRHGDPHGDWRIVVVGPRSEEVRFSTKTSRQWGIRFSPLGWAALVGVPADRYADRMVDGEVDPVFAAFRPLYALLGDETLSPGAQLECLVGFLEGLERRDVLHEGLVIAIGNALIDPEVRASSDLVARVGAHPRMVERVCRAIFGFTPKLLLRRQRFLRSIEQFTLDPSLKWIGAMDEAYHDQAQFVRDFRAFMGMTPRQYAKLDKPLAVPIMRERKRARITFGA